MEIKRQKPVVEAYHFDMRTPEDNVEPKLNVGFAPLKAPDENYPKENSILGARLQFQVVLAEFIIRGTIGQINHIIGRQVSKSDDLSREEANELVEPLFDMLQRLTYEVTEIATDKPGIKLNFNQEEE
ncbi:DUF1149 family protein [Enterococcus saccharolyticus]|uniref:DUF1149 family protein n=1 Tax=Enterococcus TaxID=1350 RepID=UPI001E5BC43C|nr:DUF1149 family protein [Enterococcus saccharolyticus]MCD5002430.1 DUF1149 family protein [Enterococcus saccharolyticus]